MFWDRFYQLCIDKETRPNPVCAQLGFSSATSSRWKKGVIPNGDALIKIADYFDVSVDYLLGKTDNKKTVSDNTADTEAIELFKRIKQLPEDKQQQAFDYVRFLLSQQDKK